MNLTEGQLLFRLQDFHGAEQEASGIGDYEFAQESADIASALRELLQARRTIEELTAVVGQRNGECVRLHSLLELAEKRIAELEEAQSLHDEGAYMLCGQFDELAAAMGWTSEIAMAQGVSQLEFARNLKARLAELEARTVTMPKPHAHLIWIQAGYAPDDYWDDVAISRSEQDKCCDGSARYPVYAHWEIEEALTAAGISIKGSE
ncbi:hypothetical protein [Yokenella regensburgei]|uniref:hypothetical protein n=1 Tax=Yokenella regensburgei TaxID=158877 RepID=UPI001FD7BBA2|nr:hypothetical protein [Yokenella regensburgei]